jgi:hypothetical protein
MEAAGTPIHGDVSALGLRNGTVTFRMYAYNNSGATDPLRRGLRGSSPDPNQWSWIDLKVYGGVL